MIRKRWAHWLGQRDTDYILALFYNLYPRAMTSFVLCARDQNNPYDAIALALADTFPDASGWHLERRSEA